MNLKLLLSTPLLITLALTCLSSTTSSNLLQSTLIFLAVTDCNVDALPKLQTVFYTHQNADGNRLVQACGSVPIATPIDIPLSDTPAWVVGTPGGDEATWVTVSSDGALEAFRVDGRDVTPFSIHTLKRRQNEYLVQEQLSRW